MTLYFQYSSLLLVLLVDLRHAESLYLKPLCIYPIHASYILLWASHSTAKMEDTTMIEEEDSKQFDAVNGGHEEDNQPDPDESLMMDTGDGRVWLVKVRT